jgi:hypothetical protein
MRIGHIGIDQPTVVVLGAGATRGATFVKDAAAVLPPLDTDFFTQAQRLSSSKPADLLAGMIRDVVAVFGTNFKLTMEGYLTQIEHLRNVFDDYKLQGRPAHNPYPEMRDRFMQVLAAVMDEALGRSPCCNNHIDLANALAPEDTILSFNYDWLMDITLRDHRHTMWNPRVSYGVEAYVQGDKGKGTQFWAPVDGETRKRQYPNPAITLLKLHGSMNWFPIPADRPKARLQLRQRWWHQNGMVRFEIAPPEWNKPIRSGVYVRVWRQARRALRESRAIAFVGYSLPHTDLPAKALFMVDAGRQATAPNLDLLVLVNPDREARARIRDVLNRRVTDHTRVVTFDYFDEFAEFLRVT